MSLVILIAGSVAVTFLDAAHHDQDMMAIHVANKQSQIVYQMAYQSIVAPNISQQADLVQQFDDNLTKLRHGGEIVSIDGHVVRLKAAGDEALLARLDAVEHGWDTFQARLEGKSPGLEEEQSVAEGATPPLQVEAEALLGALNALDEELEERSYLNTVRIQLVHVGILLGGVALLLAGTHITRVRIIQPLTGLTTAARSIARGERSVSVPVTADTSEVGQLVSAFRVMQGEIDTAQLRLENRLALLTKELTAVFEISQEIVRQQETDTVLELVTSHAKSLLAADATQLCLIDEEPRLVRLASRNGTVLNHGPQQPWQAGLPDHMIELDGSATVSASCSGCTFLSSQYNACSVAPVVVGSKQIGTLCAVRYDQRPFNDNDSRYLSLLANSAAIAIANARLIETNEQKVRETAVLNERERIAAELHDNIAQILSYCNLQIEQIEATAHAGQQDPLQADVQKIKAAVETAQAQLRVALQDLNRASVQAPIDLVRELAAVVDDFRRKTGLEVEFTSGSANLADLPAGAQRQVLFIVREALTNVERHARARTVHVQIAMIHDEISFIIADDGRGFPPERMEGDAHYGLSIMRERARRSGGLLTVNSTPGQGTSVILSYSEMKEGAERGPVA